MLMTEQDAIQREKNELYRQLRHTASLCTCPSYITITELKYIISILKGEK